jgi:hypothetical protein
VTGIGTVGLAHCASSRNYKWKIKPFIVKFAVLFSITFLGSAVLGMHQITDEFSHVKKVTLRRLFFLSRSDLDPKLNTDSIQSLKKVRIQPDLVMLYPLLENQSQFFYMFKS